MMEHKLVLITGANSGIGKAAALRFALEGYKVVMACRNLKSGLEARNEIIEKSENQMIALMQVDMSSFKSIKNFCNQFTGRFPKLDILIHNAGYFSHGEKEYQLSQDGIEMNFATNTFGPFLMSILLKYQLSKSDDPRILHACSTNIKHFLDPKRAIDFDNLCAEKIDEQPYNDYKFYGDSKMGLMMLTIKMAEVLKKDAIKVNAVLIPGIRQSKASRRKFKGRKWRLAASVMQPFLPTPDKMADVYFHVCTSGPFTDVSGRLVNINKKVLGIPDLTRPMGFGTLIRELGRMTTVPAYACQEDNISKVWSLSMALTAGFLEETTEVQPKERPNV